MNSLIKKDYLYYFDTNAIYYYCGENADGFDIEKFRLDMKTMPNKILPSCVYQEMIVKYRNDTDELGRMLTILATDNFKIAPSQYDFLGDEFTYEMDIDLKKAIESQYKKKIDNEARLIYLIIYFVSMVFTRILGVHEGIKDVDKFMRVFVIESINSIEQDKLNFIKEELEKAYEIDDTENVVKKLYNDICFEYCTMAYAFAYGIKNISSDGKCHKDIDEYMNDPFTKKLLRYKNAFNEFFEKFNKNHKDIIEEAKIEIPSFFTKRGYTLEQGEFIKSKLEKWLLHKAKLEKNDIYDMFFMFGFSDYSASSFNAYAGTNIVKNDIKLLSFDGRTKNFIGTFSKSSVDIVNGYKIEP